MVDGKHPERRARRPHQDWYLWHVAWLEQLRPLMEGLRVEKRMVDARGSYRHPRRIETLKSQVRTLLKIRRRVRQLVRAEVERERAVAVHAAELAFSHEDSSIGASLP
jgi:hypothetical protein